MRDLTKSIFSFSWALSLFGLQQTTNLMSPEKASKAFDSVTEATEKQFADVLKTTFNAGEKLQRSTVDMTLGMFSGESLNPNRLMRLATEAAKQSAETLTQGVQGVTSTVSQEAAKVTKSSSSCGSCGGSDSKQSQGWGPMPSH